MPVRFDKCLLIEGKLIKGGKMTYTFKIFYGNTFSNHVENIKRDIEYRINSETEEYILNVNENEYIDHLVQKNYLEPLGFDFENKKVIRAPGDIILHIPYFGESELSKYQPSTFAMRTYPTYLENNMFCFTISNKTNAEDVKNEIARIIDTITDNSRYLSVEVERYNNSLQDFIINKFKARKNKILKEIELLYSLDIPVVKREDLPETFTISPLKNKKKALIKPNPKTAYAPEPRLDDITYYDILQTIHDLGIELERLPNIAKDMDENTIRDLILFQLSSRYIGGSVTGETFNKQGKTDILMKYENKNAFIAECKFWKSENVHKDSISQLLSYLTWRDSKSSLIVFVRNKDITPVIKKIKQFTEEHPNFIAKVNEKSESWINYKFHLNGDKERKIDLAVLIFHVPN
ncbi:hypothetical protein [Methanococcus maripaludis]|uniref:Putative FlaG/YvyC family protein n=1 Tax=Methanococcus maripaludis TaxID=39152 RepID=A0A7J9PW58_METMI|nr:hypothetical protein [Methanococcus maripaludis]MBA2868900.1 putative FlaG/YvyC family protein [Methanococcus maripaludis]